MALFQNRRKTTSFYQVSLTVVSAKCQIEHVFWSPKLGEFRTYFRPTFSSKTAKTVELIWHHSLPLTTYLLPTSNTHEADHPIVWQHNTNPLGNHTTTHTSTNSHTCTSAMYIQTHAHPNTRRPAKAARPES